MSVKELSHEKLQQLKMDYINELANEGTFGEMVYGDPTIAEPSYGDYINADELISDEIVYSHYSDTLFTEDDFFG